MASSAASTPRPPRQMPGVLGGLYRRRSRAGYGTLKCIVPFKNRDGTDMKKPPRRAADRQGALRRRPGRVRGRRDACCRRRTPPKPSRSISIRCLPSPIPRKPRAAGRAAALRRGARQCRARLSLWRHRAGRGRLRQRRPCHEPQDRQQPPGGERDGAARRGRRLRRRAAALRSHADRRACSACAATSPRS